MKDVKPLRIFAALSNTPMNFYTLGPVGTGRGFATRRLQPFPPLPDPCAFRPLLVPTSNRK